MSKATKKFFKSKTMWFNLITGALTVVDALSGNVIPREISGVIIAGGNLIIKAFQLSQKEANDE